MHLRYFNFKQQVFSVDAAFAFWEFCISSFSYFFCNYFFKLKCRTGQRIVFFCPLQMQAGSQIHCLCTRRAGAVFSFNIQQRRFIQRFFVCKRTMFVYKFQSFKVCIYQRLRVCIICMKAQQVLHDQQRIVIKRSGILCNKTVIGKFLYGRKCGGVINDKFVCRLHNFIFAAHKIIQRTVCKKIIQGRAELA